MRPGESGCRHSPRLPARVAVLVVCLVGTAWTAAESGMSTGGRALRRSVVPPIGTATAVPARPATSPRGQSAPAGVPPPTVVAVEPFANISGDPADAWLGAGIAATVAADLDARGLAVVEGSGADGGRGARWVVTGGYQRLGERLRITARLVEADTGTVVKSARLDGALDEVFALQDRVVIELTAGGDLEAAAARPGNAGPRRARATAGSAAAAGASDRTPGARAGSAASSAAGARSPAPASFVEGIILPQPSGEGMGASPAGRPNPPPSAPEGRVDAAATAADGEDVSAGVMG